MDLVAVFQAAEYEGDSEENSTWATRDWNGKFDSSDFVSAFEQAGYERGGRDVVACSPGTGF